VSPGRGLWTPDEPREAEIGREMYLAPSFVPRLNGAPFCEKPPLYYWALGAAYWIAGGPSPAAGRALSGLLAFLTLIATYLWARRHAGPGAAHAAAFMLATSVLFFQGAHWVYIDPALALLLTLTWWAGFECLARPRPWLLLAFYGSLALGLWAKGLVALAFPAAGLGLFFVAERKRSMHLALRPILGACALLATAAACVGAFYLAVGGEAVRQLFWVNQILRFVSPQGTGHAQPFYYYLQTFPLALLPWLPPALASARRTFWAGEHPGEHPDLRRYLGWVTLGGLVLLSLATTKRPTYVLPLLPPAFLLIGVSMAEFSREAGRPVLRWQRVLFGRVQPVWMAAWGLLVPTAVLVYTRSPWPRTLNLVALGALAGVLGVLWSWRGLWPRAWEAQRLSAVVFCVAALGLAVPILDARKDMAPFFRWVDAQVPQGESLVVVNPDETLYGIIPFATGRTVTALQPDELSDQVARSRAPALLVEQVDPEIPDLRLADRGFVMLREGRFGRDRTVRLWKFFGPGQPEGRPPA
jgi:4-amino-4-deoxy-L-arabinose transferase-like glycosyltransferase